MQGRIITYRPYRMFIFLAMLSAGCSIFRPPSTPTQPQELPERIDTLTLEPPDELLTPSTEVPATTAPAGAVTETPEDGTGAEIEDRTVTASPPDTTCTLPNGWIIYTIQSGDTLDSLAEQTGSTVEVLMSVNCLESDLIIANEVLFLPNRPPPPAVGQPPPPTDQGSGGGEPPTPIVDCNDSMTCVIPGATLPVLAGGPGNPSSYEPCKEDKGGPWIDIHTGVINPLQQGDRTFFYACQFSVSGGMVAEAIPVSGGPPIPLTTYTFHPAMNKDKGNAQAVIDFPARPDMTLGLYNVHISVGAQIANPVTLAVKETNANQSFILPVPLVGSPGDTFQVYYVNYPFNETLTIVLYSADPPGVRADYEEGMIPRLSWIVPIDQTLNVDGTPTVDPAGWAVAPITFPPFSEVNAYAIADEARRGGSMLWIK